MEFSKIKKVCDYCGEILVDCMHLREELVIGIQPGSEESNIKFKESSEPASHKGE